jgi:hypothetical protein
MIYRYTDRLLPALGDRGNGVPSLRQRHCPKRCQFGMLHSMRIPNMASVVLTVVVAGCATLQQIAALRSVDFQIDRVADVSLAGVNISGIRSYSDLGLSDAARVGSGVARGELPLAFRLHLLAENPAENSVTARLVRMRWTLFLEDTETVSGEIEQEYELPPGRPTDIPVQVELDLFDFFERSGPDLVDLALNLAGAGGAPKQVSVRASPTINTALGPITYPQPITIVSATMGH